MRRIVLIAGIGLVSLACGGCSVRTASNDQAADAGGKAEGPDSNRSGIHVDLDGVRADIDAEGTDIRVDRDGVAVNIQGGDVEAKVRAGEDPSVSVTTNRR